MWRIEWQSKDSVLVSLKAKRDMFAFDKKSCLKAETLDRSGSIIDMFSDTKTSRHC